MRTFERRIPHVIMGPRVAARLSCCLVLAFRCLLKQFLFTWRVARGTPWAASVVVAIGTAAWLAGCQPAAGDSEAVTYPAESGADPSVARFHVQMGEKRFDIPINFLSGFSGRPSDKYIKNSGVAIAGSPDKFEGRNLQNEAEFHRAGFACCITVLANAPRGMTAEQAYKNQLDRFLYCHDEVVRGVTIGARVKMAKNGKCILPSSYDSGELSIASDRYAFCDDVDVSKYSPSCEITFAYLGLVINVDMQKTDESRRNEVVELVKNRFIAWLNTKSKG